jgi:type IV conjugative transfer system coupling protein TraD
MVNNFIGGGQVFLHKVRMFWQVFSRTIHIAFLVGIILAIALHSNELRQLDCRAFYSYRKAVLADSFDDAMNKIRASIGNKPNHITFVNAKTKAGIWGIKIDPRKIVRINVFKEANTVGMLLCQKILIWSIVITLLGFIAIVFVWSKFGKNLKTDKIKDGENKVLTAKEVRKKLCGIGQASDLKIGDMPLVKDMETRHFMVSGSTGSGKTNLIHNLLLQIERKGQPAIVIDQTGEMIARYYDRNRGDIIFNPFDDRGMTWNFWADCSTKEELERFSKILFGFNRKKSRSGSDPFWEQSAEIVFNACAEYTRRTKPSIEQLTTLVRSGTLESLSNKLKNTEAARYLDADNKTTSGSVLSVLATNARPITYLKDIDDKSFSLKEYFTNIDNGATSWLFLATKPSSRELTQSLIACITELALCQLMDIGIKENRRVWFVLDELAALGKLPALSTLMSEGRKYGACIISGIQSLNQLYANYGQYEGSTIFGQFGTSFFFRNTENIIARTVSSMSGNEIITRQQKNTSFGANEFRDGISYSEQEQKKQMIEPSDLASLATGQCYVFLPDPIVRIAKIQIPKISSIAKNSSFVAKAQVDDMNCNDEASVSPLSNNTLPEETISTNKINKSKTKSHDKRKTKSNKANLKAQSMEIV